MTARETALRKRIANEIPGFSVESKEKSLLHKIIGILFKPFCPDYMTRFSTTIYPKVYLPRNLMEPDNPARFHVLAHEWVHLYDRHREGWLFNILYLFPQILAPLFWLMSLSVLPWVVATWTLIGLGFACLLPWPAPFRRQYELRGYALSWALNHWDRPRSTSDLGIDISEKDRIANRLCGWDYYMCCWSKKKIMDELDQFESWLEGKIPLEDFEGRPMYPITTVKTFVDCYTRK